MPASKRSTISRKKEVTPAAKQARSRTSRATTTKTKRAKTATTKKPTAVTKKRVTPPAKPKTRKFPVKKVASQKSSADSVVLPAEVSSQAIEKSQKLQREFDHYFREAMCRIAYVSAVCFLLVGAFTIFTSLPTPHSQRAEVIDTNSTTTDVTSTTSTDGGVVSIPHSTFDLLTTIPSPLRTQYEAKFLATYVDNIRVELVNYEESREIHLQHRALVDDKFSVVIPAQELPIGYYELHVEIDPMDGSGRFLNVSNKFFIGTPNDEYLYNNPDQTNDAGANGTTAAEEDSSTEDTSNSGSSSGSGSSDTTDTSDQPTSTSDTAATDDVRDTKPEPIEVVDNTTDPALTNNTLDDKTQETALETTTPEEKPIEFSLTSPAGTTLTGIARLRPQVSVTVPFIELYARPANSLTERFVGLAEKRLDAWVVVFDSTNLPNGEYMFFAKTKLDSKLVTSRALKLTVYNTFAKTVTDTTPTQSTEQLSTTPQTTTPTTDTSTNDRELLTTTTPPPEPSPEPIQYKDPVIKETTDTIVATNRDELDELLKRYSSAKQTGDETLILAAKAALAEKRNAIILATTDTTDTMSDGINADLSDRLDEWERRIDAFEEIRREKTSGASALDTDQDGISDVDERTLYGTDPASADSDNDGFPDGVELIRGFDPQNATPEAVVQFESPREVIGLAREDVLSVTEITPVVHTDAGVATEIRGKGLPSSYVTLYIFSTPTVVTIRTDVDGNFVYTYDKELDDGEHQVYAAVIDNAGQIMAHSNPFSFVKEAQAFSPVSAATDEVVLTAEPPTATQDYNLVLGLSVLSLGLILLMLGVTLRRRNHPSANALAIDTTDLEMTAPTSTSNTHSSA